MVWPAACDLSTLNLFLKCFLDNSVWGVNIFQSKLTVSVAQNCLQAQLQVIQPPMVYPLASLNVGRLQGLTDTTI